MTARGSAMPAVRVVTDSTASLPADLAAQAMIDVVPLHVIIDGQSYLEGVDCTPKQIAAALSAGAEVSTSQPTPEQFIEVFSALAAQGAREIVSVHLSGKLSGTAATARAAAEHVEIPVRVVDSATAAMGLGFAALRAARCSAGTNGAGTNSAGTDGAAGTNGASDPFGAESSLSSGAQVAHLAARVALSSRAVFLVESLEHLRKGGRLGRAASTVGTLLGLRPLLTLDDGEIAVLQKIRTRRLAIERLKELAVAEAKMRSKPLIAVHHDGSGQDAAELAEQISKMTAVDVVVSPVSAVLAAHVGPGMLATVVSESL